KLEKKHISGPGGRRLESSRPHHLQSWHLRLAKKPCRSRHSREFQPISPSQVHGTLSVLCLEEPHRAASPFPSDLKLALRSLWYGLAGLILLPGILDLHPGLSPDFVHSLLKGLFPHSH